MITGRGHVLATKATAWPPPPFTLLPPSTTLQNCHHQTPSNHHALPHPLKCGFSCMGSKNAWRTFTVAMSLTFMISTLSQRKWHNHSRIHNSTFFGFKLNRPKNEEKKRKEKKEQKKRRKKQWTKNMMITKKERKLIKWYSHLPPCLFTWHGNMLLANNSGVLVTISHSWYE